MFYANLVKRLSKFGLEIAEEKTKIIRFGRGSEIECKQVGLKKPSTFDFLGFTHYWGKGKKGSYRLMRKTSNKKFRTRVKEFSTWMRKNRHLHEIILVDTLRMKLLGHYRYYGVSDNTRSLELYYEKIIDIMRKWRNRRSQKGKFTFEDLKLFLARNPLPLPKVYVNLYSSQTANGGLKSRMR